MNQKLLLLVFFSSSMIFNSAKATESEPNNDRATANTFALNGNNNGKIGPAGDQDWWKITTTAEGRLDITLTPVSGKYIWIYVYDNDGTTQLSSKYGSATFTSNTDGLAAGTYYVKIVCYYATDTASYTMSNALVQPAQANDAEPNGTRAQAVTLNLNGSTTGHVGYYYNLKRDTADWYKVTTNADGRLRISLTPANSLYAWIYIYDNNGTTLLASGNGSVPFSVSQDGLLPGTYYVKITCYYNYQFIPYTLSDSLFKPAQANDKEPNDTRANAGTLLVNKSTTGHVGYYYNLKRDTSDWYKITTNTDGLLRVTLNPVAGVYAWIYIYDNDGTTLLNSANSSIPFSVTADGLAAGTFYVKVKCYYDYQFTPYVLSDSLFTYTNAKDAEPNNKPYLGKTIPANGVVTGHVGFLNNSQRDTSDWWKINYTGSGALKVTAKFDPPKTLGYRYIWMDIYKDTAAAPIFSNYTNLPSLTANFGSLTQGYYFVRIRMYYNYEFETYSLTDTFTQVNVAAIKATSYDTVASCTSINTVSFKCTKSKPPYTVNLYRYNVLYATKTFNGANANFNSLPPGSYYARAFGDGATGAASGKSKNVSIVPIPTGLSTTSITQTQARLNWTPVSCAKFDSIYYRVHGTTTWIHRKTTGNPTSFLLTGLAASTAYDWEIAAVDSANGIIATGAFSGIVQFTTAASPLANIDNENSSRAGMDKNSVAILPDPAVSYFVIQYKSLEREKISALLIDVNGKAVWSSGLIDGSSLNGKRVSTDQLAKGMFYLKIMNEYGELKATAKVVVTK